MTTSRKFASPAWQASAWEAERTDRVNYAPPARDGAAERQAGALDPKLKEFLRVIAEVLHEYLPRETARKAALQMMEGAGGIWEHAEAPGTAALG